MTRLIWQGQLRVEGQAAWWSGSIGDAAVHRHYAAQALFSDTPVRMRNGAGDMLSGTCLLVEPDTPHQLLPASAADICYVEPIAASGLPEALRDRIRRSRAVVISGERARPFWTEALARPAVREVDARVADAMAAIERFLPLGPVRLADVCRGSSLSMGRLRHLFASETGIPFQRYVLWCRLRAAFDHLLAGSNITQAAHASGFADAAHFARTIKAMFGIRASDLFLTE